MALARLFRYLFCKGITTAVEDDISNYGCLDTYSVKELQLLIKKCRVVVVV